MLQSTMLNDNQTRIIKKKRESREIIIQPTIIFFLLRYLILDI